MSARSKILSRGPAGTVCSALALATALVARPVQAQQAPQPSYNLAGNPTVASGNVTFDRGVTTPGTDVYTVGTATAVLDLVPADTATGGGVINFQNGGTTALYTSTPGGPAFTILNRIVPADASRPIAFNGNVVSQLQNAAGAAARGGSVWFYSPGGIVVGDGAVFDVGNLLLSTGDPTGGTGTIGSTTSFGLNSTPDGGGIVNILSGATINAVNPGSYVALVAPIVFQRGTVNINGSAAYVAAEQANLTFNQGLFDITVTVGSSAAGGIPLQHLGTTRFQDVATPSRAYLVAVPKNDAITLIVGNTADIGFDVATTVGVENGLVVLGSGFRGVGNTPDFNLSGGFSNQTTVAADLGIDGGGTFNAGVIGRARDRASLIVNASTQFGSDVGLRGGTVAQAAGSGAGTVLAIRGNLTLDATAPGIVSAAAQTGGGALLTAIGGGRTQIGGNVRVDSSQRGNFQIAGANGASTGGTAGIVAQDGNVAIGGDAFVLASGTSATTGTGGAASVAVGSGFALTVGGNLNVSAFGSGLNDSVAIGNASGGNGTGGTATIMSAGTLSVTGGLSANAGGSGGSRTTAGTGDGGTATGGTARITTQAGGSIAATSLNATAQATGGASAGDGSGGAATGGQASLGSAGTLTANGAFVIATATGGGKGSGLGNAGGATAGTTLVQATGSGTLAIAGNARVESNGLGGAMTGGSGSGGAGTGGDARITATGGGGITLGSVDIGSGGVGGAGLGAGVAGGDGSGSTTSISQGTGGSVAIAGNAFLVSNGIGGASPGGAGGVARAGDVRFVSNDGNLTAGGVAQLTAQAVGGAGITGGAAIGGLANIGAASGLTRVTGNAQADASAFGGAGSAGNGGAATGGQGLIGTVGTGTITLGSTVNVAAGGTGGAGSGSGVNGGQGTGGTSQLFASQGAVTAAGAASIGGEGIGGGLTGTGTAGAGQGGSASITAGAGTVTLAGSAVVTASGTGGATTGTGGNAGAATGGITQISVADSGQGGGGAIGIAGAVTMRALASAGVLGDPASTGNGGAASGGIANIFASAGNITLGNVIARVVATASIGADATAANATGGTVTVSAGGGDIAVNTNLNLSADASGGTLATVTTARDGGSGTGGTVTVASAATRRVSVGQTLQVSANGSGGQTLDGGDRVSGAGVGGTISLAASGAITANAISASASGTGGSPGNFALSGVANAGGAGTGGVLEIAATGGTITTASLNATGNGTGGGAGLTGDGGDGTGGRARLSARGGGGMTVTGGTLLAVTGRGGDGGTTGAGGRGGTGQGGTSTDNSLGAIIVGDGGNILLGTGTNATANGFGGRGYGGAAAGAGNGGYANVVAFNGAVNTTAGALTVAAVGLGGVGMSGGSAGGSGTGGTVAVSGGTRTGAATAAGRLTLANASLQVAGSGGNGADGAGGLAGGAGGAGTGGRADLIAQAGNGFLVAPRTTINTDGVGGAGGAGGVVNAIGAIGAGGAGGIGTGGGGNAGTASGADTAFTTGTATLGNLFVSSSGTGGAGGNAQPGGIAGTGGAGLGGSYAALSRGALVTANAISLTASGFGGAGGNGGSGPGGRGEGGELGLLVTNRFQATARGSLTAQQFITDASGVAGGAGAAAIAGTGFITLINGDATIGNVIIGSDGDTAAVGRLTNLDVTGGTLTIPALSITAVGDIGIYTSGTGAIAVGSASLTATGTLRFGDGITPSNVPGDITIDDLFANLGGDFIVENDVDLDGNVSITAGGRIQTGDIAAETVGLSAAAGISVGSVAANGFVAVDSGGDIVTRDVASANGSVTMSAAGGLTTGNVRAGDSIALSADGALTAGNLTALTQPALLVDGVAGSVTVTANGDIAIGNVLALDIDIDGTDLSDGPYGNIATGTLTGEFIEVQGGRNVTVAGVTTAELFAGGAGDTNFYAAQLGAIDGNLTVGAIDALGLVGLASTGGGISTGAITTPSSIVALAANGVSFASARSGQGATDSVFVANASMLQTTPALAAVLADNEADQLDPAVLTTLTPVRIGGAFTTTGPIVTGNLIAAAQGGVALGAITASTRIALDSGAAIALGDVTTPASLDLASDGAIGAGTITAASVGLTSNNGGIATGAITAPDEIVLLAPSQAGTISTGLLTSGNEISVTGGGAVTVGGAILTAFDQDTGPFGVGIIAGTALTIGAVDSAQGIGLLARGGDITAGGLTARTGNIVMLARGSVNSGAIATAAGGIVLIGNASQFPADFDANDDDFDPGPILNATPVRVGGAITLAGPVTTGTFRSASSGAINAQAITAGNALFVDTGGGATLGAIGGGQTAYVGGSGAIAIAGATVTQGRLTVDTAGNIAIGTTRTGTDTLLIATGGRIDATGPITAGASIALLADSGIAAGALSGGRGDGAFVYLAGAANRQRIAANGAFPATFATDPASLLLVGPLSVSGPVSGGLVRSSVDGASRFDGPIDAAQRVRLFSRGLAINGAITAPAIELFSTDIALARGIAVGGATTQTIALGTLSTAATTTLGGAGGDAATGYMLDATELAQLRAAAISFGQSTRFGSGDQPVVVRDLTLLGADGGQGANLTTADGTFTINALGDIRVLGNVRLNNATANNALLFNATGAFDLLTDTGSIGVFGTGDALGGRLAITASEIASADSRLFALGDATDFDDAEPAEVIAAVGTPAARTRAEGFIQAGRLELSASDSIVIQNSGTATLAGGFTAGSGGLRITGSRLTDGGVTGGDGVAVIVYGRVQGEGGAFVTNADTRGAITFASGTQQGDPLAAFADFSVVNGCALLASVACSGIIVPPARAIAEVTIGTDVQGILNGPQSLAQAASDNDDGGVAAVPDVRLTTVIDAAALRTDSIVTDPVGSGGNASLWEGGDADGPTGSKGDDDEQRRKTSGGEGGR